MRLGLLLIALLCFAVAPLATSSPLLQAKKGSVTLVGNTTDHSFEVTISYMTDADGVQSGSITIKEDGEETGTTYKFSSISYSCGALEAYWGTEGGGASLTLRDDGTSSGLISIPGHGTSIQFKEK